MPAVFGQHLLAETENVVDNLARRIDPRSPAGMGDALDGGLNLPSSTLNEAHHINVHLYTEPKIGHRYQYLGSLISSNIFACDVTDPLHIKPVPGTVPSQVNPLTWSGAAPTDNICGLAVGSRKLRRTSAVDDFLLLPNGNIVVTQMGCKGRINGGAPGPLGRYTIGSMPGIAQDAAKFPQSTLTPTLQTPGGLLEFDPRGNVVGEYPAAIPAGALYPVGPMAGQRVAPVRFRARVSGRWPGARHRSGGAPSRHRIARRSQLPLAVLGLLPRRRHGRIGCLPGRRQGHPGDIGLRRPAQPRHVAGHGHARRPWHHRAFLPSQQTP